MKTIRRALLRTLPCMMLFHAAGWSQIVNGIQQGGLTNPNGYWNHHPFAMQDYSAGGVFRIYWSCGNPNGICVGHATSQTFFDFQPISINNSSPAVCDIQDPTVVKFNGMYYLYAAGIRANSPGCKQSCPEFSCCHLCVWQRQWRQLLAIECRRARNQSVGRSLVLYMLHWQGDKFSQRSCHGIRQLHSSLFSRQRAGIYSS